MVSADTPGMRDSMQVGTILTSRTDGTRLLMVVAIDPAKAEAVGAGSLVARLRAGESFDCSVGCFVATEQRAGTFGGKSYAAVWTAIRPDHLAIVTRGACDQSMGCALNRAAQFQGERKMKAPVMTPDELRAYAPPDPWAKQIALRAAADGIVAVEMRSQPDGTPPDPYAMGISALRAADAHAESTPNRPVTLEPEELEALGSYAADVAKMRSANR